MSATRILLFVDPHVRTLDPYDTVMNSIYEQVVCKKNREEVVVDVYDQIRVEPNNVSFQHAIQYMQDKMSTFGQYDAIIALGGGSTIDTAKAANLYACCPPPGNFYDYVNPPLGKGMSIPSQSYLTPLIAIPTTAGTGSETTSVAIFDDVPTRSKTGIANKRLRPTLGIVDPNNMRTLPSSVAKYSGMDVLCHALESYTAIPHWLRPNSSSVSSSPSNRPAYQGSNPISDIWSLHALRECAMYLPRMVNDSAGDEQARSKMCLASSSAGMGFGNAGVHLCHGMSYAVASQVKDGYWTEGYPKMMHGGDSGAAAARDNDDNHHGLVAHGLSVAINAPAVFRFTGKPGQIINPMAEKYSQDRHAECALILHNARLQRLTNDNSSPMTTISEKAIRQHPGEALANELLELMHLLNIPVGLRSLGYNESDVKELARATLPQHRVTKLSPRQPIELEQLQELFTDAM
jgi:hydroxyacid-oxoacid transhydrogenase